METKRIGLQSEKGFILPLSLILLAVLVLVAASGALFTNTDTRISSNYRNATVAFAAAEGGLDEARERMRANAPTPITDPNLTSTAWRAFIGTAADAAGLGYNSASSDHSLTASLQTAMSYSVSIRHQTDGAGVILLWGDANGDGLSERNTTVGQNIYLITSVGATQNARKTLQIECARPIPPQPPAALYVKAPTSISGNSTLVNGNDQCGSGTNLPGAMTILPTTTVNEKGKTINSIDQSGGPTITGNPGITYNGVNLSIESMVDNLSRSADHSYNFNGVVNSTETPGPGDGWGNPVDGATQASPLTCDTFEIVYYDTSNASVTLNGVAGCGVLVIKGDVELHGGFKWYGPVIASGTVVFAGSGDKNVTGAIMAGGSVVGDTNVVGGGINLLYCSSAFQAQNIALRVINWLEGM